MTRGEGTEGPDSGRVKSTRRWSALVGLAIGAAGAAFVARALVRNWDDVYQAATDARLGLLLVALVLGVLGMTGIALAWHKSLRVLGANLPLLSSMRGFFVGQLGKYVPGGVWAIMGQGEWARSKGVGGAVAYTSVMLSMGAVYLAALVVVAVLFPISGLLSPGGEPRYALILLLLPIGFALIHPGVWQSVLTGLQRLTKRELAFVVPPWSASSTLVLQQIPTWLIIGATSFVISRALGNAGDFLNIISATVVAWIIGFLALPTPAGIGVREAVFIALATSLPTGIAATVAVVARLVFISADAFNAGFLVLLAVRRKRRTTASS